MSRAAGQNLHRVAGLLVGLFIVGELIPICLALAAVRSAKG